MLYIFYDLNRDTYIPDGWRPDVSFPAGLDGTSKRLTLLNSASNNLTRNKQ